MREFGTEYNAKFLENKNRELTALLVEPMLNNAILKNPDAKMVTPVAKLLATAAQAQVTHICVG
jgi:hypothetical protein